MDRNVRMAWLLDFYAALLTDKQRRVLELRWSDDLSLAEIGEVLAMSRQAVSDAAVRGEARLEALEGKLGLLARHAAVGQGLRECLTLARQAAGEEPSPLAERLALHLAHIVSVWED